MPRPNGRSLTAPRVNALSAYHYRQLDLDAAFFAHSRRAMIKALQGGLQRHAPGTRRRPARRETR